jgi:predicted phage terminase large subunit-like protein
LIEKGGWDVVKLQGLPERRVIIITPPGRRFIHEAGQPLNPEREGLTELAAMKRDLGTYGWNGQYQQDPTPPTGAVINIGWWRFWKRKGPTEPGRSIILPSRFDEILQSWDMTFKEKSDTDFVVGQVWGRRGSDKFLLDQIRGRMNFPSTITAIRAMTAKWPRARLKLVEDKANGPAIIDTLRGQIPGLVAVNPMGDKVARAYAVSPDIEAGDVYIPDPSECPWVGDFLSEWTKFPKGDNDDQVDAGTQALKRLQRRRSRGGTAAKPAGL